ncbi:SRPBCC family protein [Ramlibacter sp. 2FC]|uniref:SRPBCC family protein n=1 Tax=Ramlibacter sp. 2FC TaxID=2502188 RepID=UPI0010F925B5|nr:SRPBCC family protein [Ramlibacter sp. 2FC]
MPPAASTSYRLTTLWQFEAPLAPVWEAIVLAEAWPTWWPGIESVVTLAPGDAHGLGARRLWRCKSALPYRLSFTTCVTRIEPLRRIEGQVEGELEGRGCCRLWTEGGLTQVRHDWQVRTTPLWMNLLAPLTRPLFRWNHDALMRAGGRGLARRLRA